MQEHGYLIGYTQVAQQRLTMRGEVYDPLVARVGGALDYDVRWQPNKYEPDGFVERVRPLELAVGNHASADCPQCGARILANCADVACMCGQQVVLIEPTSQGTCERVCYRLSTAAPTPISTPAEVHTSIIPAVFASTAVVDRVSGTKLSI
jgi:hypothetical protein